jgi:hypothetical protein
MRPHALQPPQWVRQAIVAVLVTAAAFALTALLVPTIAGAEQAAVPNVPHAVGFMPAAEAPPVPERSPAGPALEVVGAVLLLGGITVVARSWVSPARAG